MPMSSCYSKWVTTRVHPLPLWPVRWYRTCGRVVYVAESVNPTVTPGQSVTPNTVIGTLYNGSSGIETGWANPGGNGTTMAAIYGQFYGANSTAFGYNFSQLLSSLGGPGGVLQNNPPTGSVPSNWPQW